MHAYTPKDVAKDSYLFRYALEVYLRIYPKEERKFATRSEFVYWTIETIGPRPSFDYHLFLTGDYDTPVEWREVTSSMFKQILHSYLNDRPFTQYKRATSEIIT
jgi:hypothetical protein